MIVPFWLIIVVTVLARVGVLIHENHLFATQAGHTLGTVVRKFGAPLHGGGPRNIAPIIIYRYTVGNLQGRCLAVVELDTFNRVRVGGPIRVSYLPGDPRNNRLDYPWENAGARWAPLDDFVIAMLIFVPGLGLAWHFGRRNRIHGRLMASGAQAWGEVTELKKTHTRNGSFSYLIFHFTTPAGRKIEGRTAPLAGDERTSWQAGDPIQVFFDPEKPENFAVDSTHPLDALLADEPVRAPSFQTIWA
jgi:hypothetical protein